MAKKKEQLRCSNCYQAWHGTSNCPPAPDSKENGQRQWVGDEMRKAYASLEKLNPTEAAEDYTITDAICALLHHARKRGFDAPELGLSAIEHFVVETTVCRQCGKAEDPDVHKCGVVVK